MTAEQQAVAKCDGNVAAAAKRLGIPRSTLWCRLQKQGGIPDPEQNVTELQKRITTLQNTVEQQQEALERARKPRLKLTAGKRPKAQSSDFIRVIIPDTHGCHIDEEASAAFVHDLAAFDASEIIMLGDHVDCGGFLATHHTMGFVAETAYSYIDDIAAANGFLDAVQKAAPKAEIHYLEGNHEARVERWCVTAACGSPKDAERLRKLHSPEYELSVAERGIRYYRQGVFYDGCRIPATIKRGHCYFTHGSSAGPNAARKMLDDFGMHVVFGHTHRIAQASKRTVDHGVICAWNVGFLAKIQPYWMNTKITGWSHAYGVQFARKDGTFLHVTVPIVQGVSLLNPLIKMLQ